MAVKQAAIAETIILTNNDTHYPSRISPTKSHNFVDILSLDAQDSPVTPTAGDYSIYVKTSIDGGFQLLQDGGSDVAGDPMPATVTGGSSMADGVAKSASFGANAIEIKVVPNGVDVATQYRVIVTQNLT